MNVFFLSTLLQCEHTINKSYPAQVFLDICMLCFSSTHTLLLVCPGLKQINISLARLSTLPSLFSIQRKKNPYLPPAPLLTLSYPHISHYFMLFFSSFPSYLFGLHLPILWLQLCLHLHPFVLISLNLPLMWKTV